MPFTARGRRYFTAYYYAAMRSPHRQWLLRTMRETGLRTKAGAGYMMYRSSGLVLRRGRLVPKNRRRTPNRYRPRRHYV